LSTYKYEKRSSVKGGSGVMRQIPSQEQERRGFQGLSGVAPHEKRDHRTEISKVT